MVAGGKEPKVLKAKTDIFLPSLICNVFNEIFTSPDWCLKIHTATKFNSDFE